MLIDVRATGNRALAIGLLLIGGVVALLWGVSDTPQLALVCLPVVLIAIRIAMTRVWVDPGGLHVRNFFRTHHVDPSEIVRFVVDDSQDGRTTRRRVVVVDLVGPRTLRMLATRFPYRKLVARRPRADAHNQADEICDELNTWLARPA